MFGAILKPTNRSFQKGMTFCRSVYVKKVMKLSLHSYLNSPRIPLYGFCICMDSAFMGRSTPTTAFDGAI